MTIRRSLLALCVLAAALALAGAIAIPPAHPAPKPQGTPPTELWKSYPLQQRPRAVVPRLARQKVVQSREASRRTAPASSRRFGSLLLVLLLPATLLAVATIFLLRSSVPALVGSSLRGRALAPSPGPRVKRKRRPPIREVAAELVTEPEPQREQEAEPTGAPAETGQPEPIEQVLELQLRELIRQKHLARVAALEREIEPGHERIETHSAEAPEPEVAPANLARCEIRLWRGFVRCQLYATLVGSDEAFALSPFFRLREDVAPNQQAEQALAALVAELERGGWTVVSEGRPWYRHTLELLAPEYE